MLRELQEEVGVTGLTEAQLTLVGNRATRVLVLDCAETFVVVAVVNDRRLQHCSSK